MTGRTEGDIEADLRGALVPVVTKNHASLTDPAEVGALLQAIDGAHCAGHGFQRMASKLLSEQGFPSDIIELQLAHAERNKVQAAYNKARRLAERRKMMQAWADYLDGLRAGWPALES